MKFSNLKSQIFFLGYLLLAIGFARLAPAATTNLITAQVTVTSATSNNFNFVLNGSTRTVTNTVTAPLIQILTNGTIAGAASNLYYQVQSARFAGVSVGSYTNGSNVLTFKGAVGGALTISGLSNWFTVTYSTQTVTTLDDFRLPLSSEPNSVATNHATEAVDGIDAFAQSKFATNSAPMGNFLSIGPQSQEASNKTFRASTIGESTITNSVLTNITRINVAVLVGTNVQIFGGTISNVNLQAIQSLYGILTALTNGTIYNVFITNCPAAQITNLTAYGGYETNIMIDGSFLTNVTILSGTIAGSSFNLTNSILTVIINSLGISMGSISTVAALGPTITFTREHNTTNAAQTGDVLLGLVASGYGDTAQKTAARLRVFAITNFTDGNSPSRMVMEVTPTGTTSTSPRLQIDENGVTVTNGLLKLSAGATNSIFLGTNVWAGDLAVISGTYSALVDSPGNNTAIDISTNASIDFSGSTATANICSFASRVIGLEFRAIFTGATNYLIVNNSGAEGTTTRRIVTGTGANLTLTNNPAWAKFRKRSTDYLLLEHSN